MGAKRRLFRKEGATVIMDRREAFDGKCEMCGAIDDLRPFGPNNENICYDCGMKDEETTKRKYYEFLEGQA